MVVITYYYYAESARAEFITPTHGSIVPTWGHCDGPPRRAICYASVHRGGTKDPSLNASQYFHFDQTRDISSVMMLWCEHVVALSQVERDSVHY